MRNVGSGNLGLTLIRAQGALEASAKPASGTPRPENTEQNVHELASVMESEAGGVRGTAPRIAVGFTILNRMHRNGVLSVHEVWSQYGHNHSPQPDTVALARQILSGAIADPTDGATHFYTPDIMPKEGDTRHGDTSGGLESVPGVFSHTTGHAVQNYRPGYVGNFIGKPVRDVPEKFFKFYKQPEDGRPVH